MKMQYSVSVQKWSVCYSINEVIHKMQKGNKLHKTVNVNQVFSDPSHLLRWVTKYKYLGTTLTDDLSDDSNMLRQRGICYARCNSLRAFAKLKKFQKSKKTWIELTPRTHPHPNLFLEIHH